MKKAVPRFQAALEWEVSNVMDVMFWLDTWIGNEPLLSLVTNPVPEDQKSVVVK